MFRFVHSQSPKFSKGFLLLGALGALDTREPRMPRAAPRRMKTRRGGSKRSRIPKRSGRIRSPTTPQGLWALPPLLGQGGELLSGDYCDAARRVVFGPVRATDCSPGQGRVATVTRDRCLG